ncbi:MAG: CAP domain-containing protein [Sphingomonas sp.]
MIVVGIVLGGRASGDFRPQRVVEQRVSDVAYPRGPALLKEAMIAGHSDARAALGLAPLLWDAALAADAQAYADELAQTGRFEHAVQPRGKPHQGENLWTGTRGAYAYGEMIGHWLAEKRDFINRPTPSFSRTSRWQDVAHYTQIVWRRTTRMGCATASNARDDYLVCRYSPPGNVVGETSY